VAYPLRQRARPRRGRRAAAAAKFSAFRYSRFKGANAPESTLQLKRESVCEMQTEMCLQVDLDSKADCHLFSSALLLAKCTLLILVLNLYEVCVYKLTKKKERVFLLSSLINFTRDPQLCF